jgi:hypothetical protein
MRLKGERGEAGVKKCPLSGIKCEECGYGECFLVELINALKAVAEALEKPAELEEGEEE